MKLVFVSNYLTHHQVPLSNELGKLFDYYFIETEEMEEERKNMGWELGEIPPYVLCYYKNQRECDELINSADALIIGSADREIVHERLKNGKIVFVYSERIYKKSYNPIKFPIHFLRLYSEYGRFSNAYLLAAGAYASSDYNRNFTFLNRAFKWGYFPEFKKHDLKTLFPQKEQSSILWAGRMIDWKRPDLAIRTAIFLKNKGVDFKLRMIGTGVMETDLSRMIEEYGLSNHVEMLGAMKPEEVRHYMEKSEIFLFTSNRNEGWGAVLNEAMNSACGVVASHSIGSVPYLLSDGENGIIFDSNSEGDLFLKVYNLCLNRCLLQKISENAYLTIENSWNARIAAERIGQLIESAIKNDGNIMRLFSDGICSEASRLHDDWFKGQVINH